LEETPPRQNNSLDCFASSPASGAPRRSKVRFASTFLCQKVIRPFPCFSSLIKNTYRKICKCFYFILFQLLQGGL
jgi:hypothetical protein